jgi:hypothetical protein
VRTGYFANPSAKRDYSRKVHIVYSGTNNALCGSRFGLHSEFQVCANYPSANMTTCERCRKIAIAKNLV